MKTTCITNSHGYENYLTNGNEYEIVDICKNMFNDGYYVTVIGDDGKKHTGHRYRFSITKEECRAYDGSNKFYGQ